MKTKRTIGALALIVITIVSLSNQTVSASEKIHLTESPLNLFNLNVSKTPPASVLFVEPLNKPKEPVKPEPPKPIEYTVVDGDNLTKIASANNTTWLRLWQKNAGLVDPDQIKPNDKLIIPTADEALPDRPVPANAPVAAVIESTAAFSPTTVRSAPRGGSAGNTYTYGYCTWYVKNRRPDLPNNLGNAETWYSRAAAQGMAVGSTPAAGAVGQAGNHVVYVERVNGDGTILISEMNYQAWNVQSSRTVSAGAFRYIY